MSLVSVFLQNLFGIAEEPKAAPLIPDFLTGEMIPLNDPEQQQSYHALRQALHQAGYGDSVVIVMSDTGQPVGRFKNTIPSLNEMPFAPGYKASDFGFQ